MSLTRCTDINVTSGQKSEERRTSSDLRKIGVSGSLMSNERRLTDHRKSQNEIDSALLQSSSTLGSGQISTHQERVEKNEDLQVKHAIRGQVGKRKREYGIPNMISVGDSSEDEGEGLGRSEVESDERPEPVVGKQGILAPSVTVRGTSTVIGGALRMNEDGTVVAPIVRRKPKKVILFLFLLRRYSKTITERT